MRLIAGKPLILQVAGKPGQTVAGIGDRGFRNCPPGLLLHHFVCSSAAARRARGRAV